MRCLKGLSDGVCIRGNISPHLASACSFSPYKSQRAGSFLLGTWTEGRQIPLLERKVKFKVFLSSGFRNQQMERPAKQLSSRHLMVKPSPRTFYVHKQKSLEQLRRISSNSLAGCCVARTKPSQRAAPSMFLCCGSCARSRRGSRGRGDVF